MHENDLDEHIDWALEYADEILKHIDAEIGKRGLQERDKFATRMFIGTRVLIALARREGMSRELLLSTFAVVTKLDLMAEGDDHVHGELQETGLGKEESDAHGG